MNITLRIRVRSKSESRGIYSSNIIVDKFPQEKKTDEIETIVSIGDKNEKSEVII